MIFPLGKVLVKPLSALVIVTESVVVPKDATQVGFVELNCKFDPQVVS